MNTTGIKILLEHVGPTKQSQVGTVYSWGSFPTHLEIILEDIRKTEGFTRNAHRIRLHNPYDLQIVSNDLILQEIREEMEMGERCVIDAVDRRAMLRATSMPNKEDITPSRADLTYIQVGRYAREIDDEEKEKNKMLVENELIVVGAVHRDTERVFFFVVDAWMFNRLWVGDVDKGEEAEDWSRYRPDRDFGHARCFNQDRLRPAVLQLVQASNVMSLAQGAQVVLPDEAGNGQEIFSIRPITLPNLVRIGGDFPPPEVELDPGNKEIAMTIVLHDRTTGDTRPLPLPSYIEGFLAWKDSYAAFERGFLKHEVLLGTELLTIRQLFDKLLRPGWTIDVHVLLHADRSLMTYSWTKHKKEIKQARRWVDNKLAGVIPRQLYIAVRVRGVKIDLLKMLGSSSSEDSRKTGDVSDEDTLPDARNAIARIPRHDTVVRDEKSGETDSEDGIEEVPSDREQAPSARPMSQIIRRGNNLPSRRGRGGKRWGWGNV